MLINEKWKRVTGFPDYEVSNTGLIKSYKKNSNGVNIIPSDNGNGYLKLSLCKQGQIKQIYVHKIVASEFIDNPNSFKEINHIDGNKSNNHADNLEWCNRSMNLKHAHRVGLKAPTDISGKKNPRYKHGLLIKVNEKKNCIVCGKEFIARLKHIQHCSRKCSSIKSIAAMNLKRISLKEQAKLEGYTSTVSSYRA